MENYITKENKKLKVRNLNPAEVNLIDPTKDNFTQPLSVKEILDELEISKDDYYRALSISNDEVLEMYLKKEPNSCFVKNYLDFGLKIGREIWTFSLILMSIKLWHICANISQKQKIYVHRR